MTTVIPGRFQLRKDTAANWTSVNPVLADGEQGYEKDTGKMKIGDGVKKWNELSYFSNTSSTAAFFDGGYPSIVYTSGPVFDMGGVN